MTGIGYRFCYLTAGISLFPARARSGLALIRFQQAFAGGDVKNQLRVPSLADCRTAIWQGTKWRHQPLRFETS
jgi:hypothetical protein